MKAEFLKLAGVKTEKQFYAKYPDEQSFFKAHPEAKKMIKKAQSGTVLSGMTDYLQSMGSVPNMQNVMQGQMQSPGVNAGMFPGNKTPDYNQMYMNMSLEDEQLKNPTDWNKVGEQVGKIAPVAGELISGYQNLRAGRRAKKEAQKWAKVTGVQADAAESVDIDDYRQYAESAQRKRDAMMPVITGEQFFPTQGVGTNVLAKNGVRLKGGGEIQNTFAPGTIYDNLEYEPLELTNQVKAYRYGGGLIKAENGFANWTNTLGGGGSGFSGEGPAGATPWGAIGGLGSSLAGNLTGNDGGGQIGGTIGGAAGAMFGPAGMAIGKTIGTLAGGLADKNDNDQRKAEAEQKYNINRMITSQFSTDYLHPKFGSNLKNGGLVSEMEEGGELGTHWGGYAEPMSYNPYLPDEGETVMFRGNSHEEYDGQGNTGIGVSFGNSDEANVEVERGEPAVKLKDGGGSDSLVVYGNLQIPKYGVEILGDKKAEGKKFKNYISDLSKVEEKQNKLVEKSTEDLNTLDVKTSFDKLKLSTLQANIQGANMKLKSIADKKIKAADLQNAINDTAEEYGLVADDLAKGKIKTDKKGMKLREAMFGTSIPKFNEGGDTPKASTYDPKKVQEIEELYRKAKDKGTGKSKEALNLQQKFHEYFPEIAKEIILKGSGVTRKGQKAGYKTIEDLSKADDKTILNTNLDEYMGPRTEQYMAALAKLQRPRSEDLPVPNVTTTGNNNNDKGDDAIYDVRAKKRNPWIDLAGQALDYLRPSDQEALNPNQLMGELYAMSSNQLEPVQATPYSPQLRVPYDISFQDQINEITADQRGAQRMMGYNPAAQSNLAAQSYGAKSRVLADQFRANQAMKDQVYSSNIATLNDAQLKNLAIYDQQYQRQEQAKSNTKAVAQEALNSISSKYAQNALENRTLGVYENLYNYRYDKSGRAVNMNAPYQANIPTVYSPAGEPNIIPVKDSDGNIIEYRRINEKRPSMAGTPINNAPEGKRGINVKKAMNGSIVKMLK